jgi:hypothetical protein
VTHARLATALLLLAFACAPATAQALSVVGPAPVFVSDLSRGIIAIDGSSGAQSIVTNQVFANSITALPGGNLFVTGDKGSSSSRGVYSVDVAAGTATLVTLLAGARAIARINSDTLLVATSDQVYKMSASGSLTPIGDPLPLNERPYIAIGANLLNGTADIWAHAPTIGGELYGYSGSGTTLSSPTTEMALNGNGVIGTPNGAGIGYTDAGTRILANARGFGGFAADGLVDGVTISSTAFIDPDGLAFESASSMLLLDSEQGLGGSVYRVDLGTGAATPLATSDGTDPTKMRIATGITTTRCFPFSCSVSPPVVPQPVGTPAPAPAPPATTTGSAKKATITFAALKKLTLSAKGISVPLQCAIACRMKVSAKLSGLGGKSVALTPVTKSLPAGKSVAVVLKLKKAQRSRVTAALKAHKRVKVAFSAVATATGATTQQLGRTLTLSR